MGGTHAVFILLEINKAAVLKAFAAWKRGHQLFLLNLVATLYQGVEID